VGTPEYKEGITAAVIPSLLAVIAPGAG